MHMMTLTKRVAFILAGLVFILSIVLTESWVLSLEFKLRGRILRMQFIVFVQILFATISLFIWKNIVSLFDAKGRSNERSLKNKAWRAVLLTYFCLAHGSYLSFVFLIREEPNPLGLLCFLCFGFHIQICTFLVAIKCINLFLTVFKFTPIRRRLTAGLAIVYALSITSFGFYRTRQPPIVKQVGISLENLPTDLDGFTITLISDIHLGPTVGRSQLDRVVDISNSLESDVVLIDGDLVDGHVNQLEKAVEPLKRLKSKYGVFYVTGNHEYYTMDLESWFEKLKDLGVNVLHNTHANIPSDIPKKNSICLLGTDDLEAERIRYEGHGMKLDKAITGCSPDQTTILLAHQPHAAKRALASKHKVDLVLCGHTHGGQMFPLVIGAYFANPFYAGLYKQDNTYIYVTQGTMYWGMPIRIMTQHEITQITLHSTK